MHTLTRECKAFKGINHHTRPGVPHRGKWPD